MRIQRKIAERDKNFKTCKNKRAITKNWAIKKRDAIKEQKRHQKFN